MLLLHLKELNYKQALWCLCRDIYFQNICRKELLSPLPSSANNLAQAAAISVQQAFSHSLITALPASSLVLLQPTQGLIM